MGYKVTDKHSVLERAPAMIKYKIFHMFELNNREVTREGSLNALFSKYTNANISFLSLEMDFWSLIVKWI